MHIKELFIPSIPTRVEIDDLQSNNKLFSEEEIAQIHSAISTDGRYRNINVAGKETRLRYAVIAQDDELFAVYSGDEKHVLGSGRYGKVKLAQNLETGEWIALKTQIVAAENSLENELQMLVLLEAAIMTGVETHPVVIERWAEHKEQYQNYILMKYAPGKELFDVALEALADNKKYKLGQIFKIIIAAIEQVQQMHQKHVLHRDIKLENFRANLSDTKVKLVDFGMSTKVDDSEEYYDDVAMGTEGYVANEVFLLHRYSERSEVYALGCCLALILKLGHQTDDDTDIKLFSAKELSEIPSSENIIQDEDLQKKIHDYLQKMMGFFCYQRPVIADVLKFFTDVFAQLPDVSKTVKVGLVEVAECDESIWQALANVDQVRLVESRDKIDLQASARIKWQLEQLDIQVTDNMYVGASAQDVLRMLSSQPVTENEMHYQFQCVGGLGQSDKVHAGSIWGLFGKWAKKNAAEVSLAPAVLSK